MEISDKSELNPKCIAAVIPKQGRNKKKMATIQTQARTTMTQIPNTQSMNHSNSPTITHTAAINFPKKEKKKKTKAVTRLR